MISTVDVVWGSKQKWRFTDEDDSNKKLETGDDLESGESVTKEDCGKDDGDYGAGEHNTQGIWYCHVGNTCQGCGHG